MNEREKRTAKIVFWCASPIMFAGIVRLFFLVFYFMFGMLFLAIFGVKYNLVILAMAIAASALSTIAALVILYRMFKKHILEE
ncbi:MAG: hypothetical protein ACLFNS_12505 [Desulfobacterales bacterium]